MDPYSQRRSTAVPSQHLFSGGVLRYTPPEYDNGETGTRRTPVGESNEHTRRQHTHTADPARSAGWKRDRTAVRPPLLNTPRPTAPSPATTHKQKEANRDTRKRSRPDVPRCHLHEQQSSPSLSRRSSAPPHRTATTTVTTAVHKGLMRHFEKPQPTHCVPPTCRALARLGGHRSHLVHLTARSPPPPRAPRDRWHRTGRAQLGPLSNPSMSRACVGLDG